MAQSSVTTKDALKKLDAQLECSLCLDAFKQPKLLPCFHVFCKSPCLEKLVAKDGSSLTCPTCRQVVTLSEKGVDGLQSDFHINHLFEIQDAFSKATQSTEEAQCGSCGEGIATGYCRDCTHLVCDSCKAAHSRMAILKTHQLVTLEEFKTQASNLIPPKKPVPHCSKHPNKKLKLYCETCQLLICSHCTVRLHQEHRYDLVTDIFLKHKEEIVSGLKPVKEKLYKVQQALKAFDVMVKEINDLRVTLEADIHREIDQQHQLLDQRRTELVDNLDVLTQQKLKRLAMQKDQVEMTQLKLASCVEYAEGGLQTGTEDEVLAMKAPVLMRIEKITAEFDPDALQPETEADMEVVAKGIEQLQKACQEYLEIREIDPVSLKNSHIKLEGLESTKPGEKKTVMLQAMTKRNKKFVEDELNIKAELVHSRSKDSVDCDVAGLENGQYSIKYQPVKRGKHELHITINGSPIRGSPFSTAVHPSPQSLSKPVRSIPSPKLPRSTSVNSKGHIVVANESYVSVLTPEGEKVQYIGVNNYKGQLSGAFGVTVDRDDNIYIAENSSNRIRKFNANGVCIAAAGNTGKNDLQFNGPHNICYNHKDNRLYVADNCNHRIQVLSTSLTFMRSFGTRGNEHGQFQNPHDIAFDDTDNLYVTDYNNHRVQVLTTEGHFVRAFSQKSNSEKLKNPFAIAIDSSNTVYVSERGPLQVSVFTSHGSFITSFGSQGKGHLWHIYGLCIDCDDSLIVSERTNGQLQIF